MNDQTASLAYGTRSATKNAGDGLHGEVFSYGSLADADNAEFGVLHDVAHYVLDLPPAAEVPVGLHSAFVYMVRVQLGDTDYCSYTLLVHEKLFDEQELKQMLDQAIAVVKETRIAPRRGGLRVKADTDIEDVNRQHFIADATFLEAVMADKFNFRVLKTINASGAMEKTINTSTGKAA